MNENLKSCPFCGGEVFESGHPPVSGCILSGFQFTRGALELWNIRGPREKTMVDIFQRIAADNNITLDKILSPSRHRSIAWPRQDGMLLCRRAGFTYQQIADYLNRDHTTAVWGVQSAISRELGRRI